MRTSDLISRALFRSVWAFFHDCCDHRSSTTMNTFSAVRRKYLHSVIAALTLSLTSSLNFASAAAAGQPLEKLIITAIPDDGDADRMRENFGALASYLGKAVGIPVEYMHVDRKSTRLNSSH